MAKKHNCEACAFRAQYDKNPNGFLGRIWHWHAGWCPGFNMYMKSLPAEERMDIGRKYNLKKFAK